MWGRGGTGLGSVYGSVFWRMRRGCKSLFFVFIRGLGLDFGGVVAVLRCFVLLSFYFIILIHFFIVVVVRILSWNFGRFFGGFRFIIIIRICFNLYYLAHYYYYFGGLFKGRFASLFHQGFLPYFYIFLFGFIIVVANFIMFLPILLMIIFYFFFILFYSKYHLHLDRFQFNHFIGYFFYYYYYFNKFGNHLILAAIIIIIIR